MDNTTSALLDQVLEWLGQDIITLIKNATIDGTRGAIHEFLKIHLPEWRALVTDVVQRGLEWGLQELEKLRPKIMTLFTEKHSLLKEILIATSKAAVKKILAKEIAKKIAVETTETFFTKFMGVFITKKVTGVVITNTGKSMLKVANPVGYVADVAQVGLELTGNKEAGQAVGAIGNVASGAMTGMAVGGPVGAAVGALAGFGIWGAGEYAGSFFK